MCSCTVLYLNVQEGSIPNERKGVEESARECEREREARRPLGREKGQGRAGTARKGREGQGIWKGREGHREGSGVQCSAYTSLVLLKRMCSLIAYSTLNVSLEFCAFTSHTTVYHIASLSHNQSALLWSPHACATDRPRNQRCNHVGPAGDRGTCDGSNEVPCPCASNRNNNVMEYSTIMQHYVFAGDLALLECTERMFYF